MSSPTTNNSTAPSENPNASASSVFQKPRGVGTPIPPHSEKNTKKNTTDAASHPPLLGEKQRREIWLYLAVTICAVEILITAGSIFYGFIASAATGDKRLVFPWISWGALAIALPCLILLAVHLAGVGLFVSRGEDEEWQQHLPERLQRLYRILKSAPIAVSLLGVVFLGAVLLSVDGILGTITRLGASLTPYIPYIAGALGAVLCCVIGAAVWLNYRTRKLQVEYDFRREVLYRTGVIIVDKDSTALPPAGDANTLYAIAASESVNVARPALPPAEPLVLEAEIDDTPGNIPANPHNDKPHE